MSLDFATHEVDPGTRIHRDINLTCPSEDQHPRPGLYQASRPRDCRSLLLDPVGVAGGVGQVVFKNGIVTDHKLTGGSRAPERGIKNDQAAVRDRGPAGVAGDIVAVDRQGRASLLHQGERSGTATQILVTDVTIIGRIGGLVDREGGVAVVSHLDPGSPLVVFDRRPSRIGSGEGQVADRQVVTEQGDIGVGVGGIEKEVHIGTELVGSTHLQHAEDSANRTGAVVPHDNGSTPSVEEGWSVGVGQRQDAAEHGRIPSEGVGSSKDLLTASGLGESSAAREHAGVGGVGVVGTYREGVRPHGVVPAPLECSEVVGIGTGESKRERAGIVGVEVHRGPGQRIGIGEDKGAGRDPGGSSVGVAA